MSISLLLCRTVAIVIPFAALLSCAAAYAEMRIAIVDMERVINESAEGSKQRKHLEELSAKTKKKIESQRAALKSKEEALRSKGTDPNSKEAEKYRAEVRNFGRFVKDSEDELKRKFLKSNKELSNKAITAIRSYAKTYNIDIVLEKSSAQKSPVLVGPPSSDITSDIISLLND